MSNSKTFFTEAVAVLSTPGVRALMVTIGSTGELEQHPVRFGQSVLNIETELRAHLISKPRTNAWLIGLRDYLSDWIRAREDAAKFGGLVVPQGEHHDMHHIPYKT